MQLYLSLYYILKPGYDFSIYLYSDYRRGAHLTAAIIKFVRVQSGAYTSKAFNQAAALIRSFTLYDIWKTD